MPSEILPAGPSLGKHKCVRHRHHNGEMPSCRLTGLLLALAAIAPAIDLKTASVVAPANLTATEKKAAAMLVDEIEKRTRIRLPIVDRPYNEPTILLREASGLGAEGYRVQVAAGGITVSGNDPRGVLFGVGALLRNLRMERDTLEAPDGLNLASAPKYALRGHQLGYRPKTNSYDGWDVRQWEQYIRDLAVFGTNAIELIPPRSDDAADSPHFPLPPMKMMIEMSRLANEYGLDVWIWYPAMDADYSDPKTVEFALKEWGEVFRQLPRIDAIFVPGGDPGHTEPKHLMALLEKQTAVLHRYHPKAQMWVSPQSFDLAWMDQFLGILKNQQPAWLTGVVFGPQVRMSLPQLRAAVPQKYPIRHYPDITHSRQAQYPGPGLGCGLRGHRGARSDQPAAHRRSQYLSPAAAPHHGLPHLFGRLQRRRQQVRLERARLESRRRSHRHPARVQPLLHRRAVRRQLRARACWRWSATGAGRSPPTPESTPRWRSFRKWKRAPRPRCWPTGGSSRRSIAPTTTPTRAPA